jgi:putative ABC transport system substrate-binding protein
LFDYGADFYQVGKQTGELAVRILRGEDPTKIPITNMVPTYFVINKRAIEGLKGSWRVSDELLQRANVIVDEQGVHQNKSASR